MNKLKVAILEDNKQLLKDLKQNLEAIDLIDVVIWATNSVDFLEKTSIIKADALLVDIDLGSDSMNGLDIAYKLKLPVLFVSGHNAAKLKEIEQLKREFNLTVDHITKPFSERDFIKTVTRFINDVSAVTKSQFVYLDFADTKRNKIPTDTIVYLCADKANGAESNNKQIFFTDRKSEILIDFSFTRMEEKGFSKNQFLTIHRSYVVNSEHIKLYKKSSHEIEVEVYKADGKTETKLLRVSENFKMK